FKNVDDERTFHGKTESQTIYARTIDGTHLTMRVRLCWRRKNDQPNSGTYSAAQLLARIADDDWEGSLQKRIDNQRAQGVSHLLLVQRDGDRIDLAALIPLSAVLSIWCAQRDISEALIRSGQ